MPASPGSRRSVSTGQQSFEVIAQKQKDRVKFRVTDSQILSKVGFDQWAICKQSRLRTCWPRFRQRIRARVLIRS